MRFELARVQVIGIKLYMYFFSACSIFLYWVLYFFLVYVQHSFLTKKLVGIALRAKDSLLHGC